MNHIFTSASPLRSSKYRFFTWRLFINVELKRSGTEWIRMDAMDERLKWRWRRRLFEIKRSSQKRVQRIKKFILIIGEWNDYLKEAFELHQVHSHKPLLPHIKQCSRVEARTSCWTPGAPEAPSRSCSQPRFPTAEYQGAEAEMPWTWVKSSVSLIPYSFCSDFSSLQMKEKQNKQTKGKFFPKWQKEHNEKVSIDSLKSHSGKPFQALGVECHTLELFQKCCSISTI